MSTWLGCRLPLLLGPAGSAPWAARLALQQKPPPRRPFSGAACCRRLLLLRRRHRPGSCGGSPAEHGLWASSRALGTHPKKEPMEALNTAQGARDFIYSLHATERTCLLRELHRFESIAIAQGKAGGDGRAPLPPRPGSLPPPLLSRSRTGSILPSPADGAMDKINIGGRRSPVLEFGVLRKKIK